MVELAAESKVLNNRLDDEIEEAYAVSASHLEREKCRLPGLSPPTDPPGPRPVET